MNIDKLNEVRKRRQKVRCVLCFLHRLIDHRRQGRDPFANRTGVLPKREAAACKSPRQWGTCGDRPLDGRPQIDRLRPERREIGGRANGLHGQQHRNKVFSKAMRKVFPHG